MITRPTQHVGIYNHPVGATLTPEAPKPRLLDQVRLAIRTRHYSVKTEEAYVGWIKRFIFFHNKRHPAEMAEAEIGQFLSTLARDAHVSASTQNQALNALLFLYRDVLHKEIGYVNGVVRAKRPRKLPVVLTREEVKRVLRNLKGTPWLMADAPVRSRPACDGVLPSKIPPAPTFSLTALSSAPTLGVQVLFRRSVPVSWAPRLGRRGGRLGLL